MKNRTSGFTLVELMVVVLLVALVVLIATQIPLFSISSWRKGMDRLKLQRDANLVMIKIQRELRPASSPDVYVSSDPSTLLIDGESFAFEGDADTTGSFDITNTDGVIKVSLTAKGGIAEIILTTAVKPRN